MNPGPPPGPPVSIGPELLILPISDPISMPARCPALTGSFVKALIRSLIAVLTNHPITVPRTIAPTPACETD